MHFIECHKYTVHVTLPINRSSTFIDDISVCGIVAVSLQLIKSSISVMSGIIAALPVKFHIVGPKVL